MGTIVVEKYVTCVWLGVSRRFDREGLGDDIQTRNNRTGRGGGREKPPCAILWSHLTGSSSSSMWTGQGLTNTHALSENIGGTYLFSNAKPRKKGRMRHGRRSYDEHYAPEVTAASTVISGLIEKITRPRQRGIGITLPALLAPGHLSECVSLPPCLTAVAPHVSAPA